MYTDNSRVMVYYQCTRVLEDGTCDPTHTHLDIVTSRRDVELNQLKWFKVLVENLCLDPSRMQLVSHEGETRDVTSAPKQCAHV